MARAIGPILGGALPVFVHLLWAGVAWAAEPCTLESGIDPLAPLFDPSEWTVVQGAPLRVGKSGTHKRVQLLKSIRPTGEDGVGRPLHSVNLLVTENGRVLYSFAPLETLQRRVHRTQPIYYVDDRGVQAGCPLEVRDVTGDGIAEVMFHSGYVGASDWFTQIHVLQYVREETEHFRDVRGERFAESWWRKFRWVHGEASSLAIVAHPVERSSDPEVACHACPKYHQYEVYRWDDTVSGFVLSETIPSTGTLHRDDEDPFQTDWGYIGAKLGK